MLIEWCAGRYYSRIIESSGTESVSNNPYAVFDSLWNPCTRYSMVLWYVVGRALLRMLLKRIL